ncbi:MAG TPA: hypothetical protein VFH78_06020 [Candidatus Thermoplasmatota archaeon]|nr:hypothetical protein [Candidatus Thermoplasmatota archaeon]
MAARKPTTKKGAGETGGAKKPKKAATAKPKGELVVTKKARAEADASADAEAKPATKKAVKAPAAPRVPVEKTRVVVPMDVYDARKDDVKAPLKEAALKWNFLGEGKGLYKREDGGVHCFVQFRDDGVHYSVWGADKPACERILTAWRALLGEEGWAKATATGVEATQAERAQQESEAVRLWKMAEPQRRPGASEPHPAAVVPADRRKG